jgi:HlyD family secretion protein
MSAGRRLLLIVAAPAVALALFLGAEVGEPRAGADPAPLTATLGDPRLVVAPGVVETASEEHEIAAAMSGRLTRVLVDEGQPVTAGQVIAEIDNAEILARIDVAAATVQLHTGELQRLVAGARPQELREMQAQLLEADAVVTHARREYERRRPLAETGVASREVMDQLRTNVAAAEARRAALNERLGLLQAPPRDEDVAIARARLAGAEAALAEAKARFERSQVRAPIDGLVLRRYRRTGETVGDNPPTPIARIGDVTHRRVRADIDEADVARVRVGQPVTVTAAAFGPQRFAGTVVRVGAQLGRKTVRTDEPTERIDTKVLETLIALQPGAPLPIGLRVDVFVRP